MRLARFRFSTAAKEKPHQVALGFPLGIVILKTRRRVGYVVANYTTSITVCNPVYYLFITYIVTSKPKRISVAAGFVHIIVSWFKKYGR
jgi:hypothetical protein